MNSSIQFVLLIFIIILLIWNILLFIRNKQNPSDNRLYFELNAKLNFLTATGSLFIILISYLGWNVKDEIIKKSEPEVQEMIQSKSHFIDSIIDSKNILKAGIYIVNNLDYKEGKMYKFEELTSFDNKSLPKFTYPPKLIISTNTGENLRIKEITNTYFILDEPISKSFVLAVKDNPEYPKKLKFDIWIADYKSK